MKKAISEPYVINSISELHRLLSLPKPEHPLVSVINLSEIECYLDESLQSVIYNFYSICIKKDFKGKMKYGQNYYDFDEGIMTFFSPGQVISTITDDDRSLSGWWLVVHPDFMRNYSLAKNIKDYGYFSYAVNEALHLSEKEEAMITSIMQNVGQEYHSPIDSYSQDVMISHIELLLNYCNRFYNRQFITRKNSTNDLLIQLEELLSDYFISGKVQELGLPTVHYIAEKLNVSPNYLSDMLRTLTGQSTQQHIHNKLIEKAKELITTTSLSVSEIAYQLGFEYPQSFSKLFKNKTNSSPLEFRQSFN
ncbi:helix-turn-helix domain-containing protein [Spirosoma flavum]|uniref:Helix-turn-helix domain-containing protein n=1 Tax=Spirosoma flavum TaxID=2048557 RepID=A0ABW6AJA3_9BACT